MWLKTFFASIAMSPLLLGSVVIASSVEDAVLVPPSVVVSQIAASAAPRDAFTGTWVGECGEGYQCEVEINQTGTRYSVALVLADWQDISRVVCRITGVMDLSDDGSYLAGQLGSSPLSGAFLRGQGRIEMHDVPDRDCGRPFALDGMYRILGD